MKKFVLIYFIVTVVNSFGQCEDASNLKVANYVYARIDQINLSSPSFDFVNSDNPLQEFNDPIGAVDKCQENSVSSASPGSDNGFNELAFNYNFPNITSFNNPVKSRNGIDWNAGNGEIVSLASQNLRITPFQNHPSSIMALFEGDIIPEATTYFYISNEFEDLFGALEIEIIPEEICETLLSGDKKIIRTWLVGPIGDQFIFNQEIYLFHESLNCGCPPNLSLQCIEELMDPNSIEPSTECVTNQEYFYESNNEQGRDQSCIASEAIGTVFTPWSLWLPLSEEISDEFIWDENGGSWNVTGQIGILQGTVQAVNNSNYKFDVHLVGKNKQPWEVWSQMSVLWSDFLTRTYKDSDGHAEALGTPWEDWHFFEVDAEQSYLLGRDGLEGSFFQISHNPQNMLYGMQVGQAANDINGNFGLSSWIRCNGVLHGEPFYTEGDINIDLTCGEPLGNNKDCSYEIERTWIAIDECYNVESCEQEIEIADNIPPVITENEDGNIEASDNCGGVELESLDNKNGTITWTATDDCGNFDTYTQIICCSSDPSVNQVVTAYLNVSCSELDDLPDPIITNCYNVIDADQANNFTISDFNQSDTSAAKSIYIQEFGSLVGYIDPIKKRNGLALSACDNDINLGFQDFIWSDCPIFNVDEGFLNLEGTTLECDVEVPTPIITNIQDAEFEIGFNDETILSQCIGSHKVLRTYYVIYNETDTAYSEVFPIQFVDTNSPTFNSYPMDMSIECGFPITTTEVTASDNCSEVTINLEEYITGENCSGNYTIIKTWTATDECGNASSVSQNINVIDTTAPIIYENNFGDIVATDNCSDVSLNSQINGDLIIWTATDECGNSSSLTLDYCYEPPLINSQYVFVDCSILDNLPELDIIACSDLDLDNSFINESDFNENNQFDVEQAMNIWTNAIGNGSYVNPRKKRNGFLQDINGNGENFLQFIWSDCPEESESSDNSCITENFIEEPQELHVEFDEEFVRLSWQEYPNATKCKLRGNHIDEIDDHHFLFDLEEDSSMNIFEKKFPISRFIPGETYRWRVRCGCSIEPPIASPLTTYQYFQVPSMYGLGISNSSFKFSIESNENISVVPNPNNGAFRIDSKSELLEIQVYDLTGKLIYEQIGINDNSINFSILKSGIYIARILDNSSIIYHQRIVVSN